MNLLTDSGPSFMGFLSYLCDQTTAYAVALIMAIVLSALWASISGKYL